MVFFEVAFMYVCCNLCMHDIVFSSWIINTDLHVYVSDVKMPAGLLAIMGHITD